MARTSPPNCATCAAWRNVSEGRRHRCSLSWIWSYGNDKELMAWHVVDTNVRGCFDLALLSLSETKHLQQLGLRPMGWVFQQQSHHAAARLALQWLQGLLRCFHEVPPGGRWWTFSQAQESHLQSRALWEYRRVDSGECFFFWLACFGETGNVASLSVGINTEQPSARVVCCARLTSFACCLTWSPATQAHWWAVLLMGIALIMLMAGFIKICSVHTPSSNPKLPPPKPLPGTVFIAARSPTFTHMLSTCLCLWCNQTFGNT